MPLHATSSGAQTVSMPLHATSSGVKWREVAKSVYAPPACSMFHQVTHRKKNCKVRLPLQAFEPQKAIAS